MTNKKTTKTKKPTSTNDLVVVKNQNLNQLYNKVSAHIENARRCIQRSIDTEMAKTYRLTGRDIAEEEQKGKTRADYASY